MSKEILKESTDVLNAIIQNREFLEKTAQVLSIFHNELVSQGFSNEEATLIAANYNFS